MPNAYDLVGKTAIVTGGAKGIGSAIAARLLTSGAQVWIWDAKPATLPGAKAVALDVTSSEQVSHALEQVVTSGSRVDILVNNAGYLGAFHAFDDHDPTDWLRIIQVNLIGMLH